MWSGMTSNAYFVVSIACGQVMLHSWVQVSVKYTQPSKKCCSIYSQVCNQNSAAVGGAKCTGVCSLCAPRFVSSIVAWARLLWTTGVGRSPSRFKWGFTLTTAHLNVLGWNVAVGTGKSNCIFLKAWTLDEPRNTFAKFQGISTVQFCVWWPKVAEFHQNQAHRTHNCTIEKHMNIYVKRQGVAHKWRLEVHGS